MSCRIALGGLLQTIVAVGCLFVLLESADAVTRLDSNNWKAVASIRVIAGLLHSKFLYGTMISFYDSKKFCRMAKDEEDSEIEIRRKLNGGSDRVNMQKICFSKVSGFSKITSAANEYYIVEIAVHQKCQAVLEYISGVVTNAARLNSIALNDHLLITSFGEFSESKVDISRRVQLASSYFNLGAAEFECLFDQSKLRITLPIQVK